MSIEMNENFIRIDSDTIHLDTTFRNITIDTLKKILYAKPKVYKNRPEHNILYYFQKIGIGTIAFPPPSDTKFLSSFDVYLDETPYENLKPYKGELIFMNLKINQKTTFSDIYNNPKIHFLLDYSYLGDTTKLDDINRGIIVIMNRYSHFTIKFSGQKTSSVVQTIYTDI